jgi:uncharacterized membrane protein
MTDNNINVPNPNLVSLTYLIYGLHLFSAITGVISSAFIVTAFLTGWPSILAVILNYIKRAETQGTYLESHFSWQIRTFWYSLLWLLIAGALTITVIGIPLAFLMVVGVGVWVIYRFIRGFIQLSNNQAMPFH